MSISSSERGMARQALQREGLDVLGEGEIDVIRREPLHLWETQFHLPMSPDPLSQSFSLLRSHCFLFSFKTKVKTTLI